MHYSTILIEQYRGKGIIVDTNLLLLLAIGQYDIRRISTFKRTDKFNADIFLAVKTVVEQFEQKYSTPNIITELDNLSRMLPAREWQAISDTLTNFVPLFIEIYQHSGRVLRHALYSKIGITDCSIAMIPDALIFTDDLPLTGRLQGLGRDVLNVSHLILDAS